MYEMFDRRPALHIPMEASLGRRERWQGNKAREASIAQYAIRRPNTSIRSAGMLGMEGPSQLRIFCQYRRDGPGSKTFSTSLGDRQPGPQAVRASEASICFPDVRSECLRWVAVAIL